MYDTTLTMESEKTKFLNEGRTTFVLLPNNKDPPGLMHLPHCVFHSCFALYDVRADNEHAKLSCAPPNQYKAMLCATKVKVHVGNKRTTFNL